MTEQIGAELVLEGLDAFESGLSAAEGAMGGIGDIAGSIASGALDALGGAFDFVAGAALDLASGALGALQGALTDGIASALEAEQGQARLAQVIQSTGGAAGVTVDEANDLAQQFMDLAGGSDDAVLSIIELGLRMGTISEQEMPGFIQSSLDLGAVMGDNTAAARLLARAQEDPVGVLGQLRRAGILVTEDMEAQIKTMVESGNVTGATALIMDRLAEATGGAAAANAETLSGKWEIFTGRLSEAGEAIGTALLPIITQLFDNVLAPAIPMIENLATQFIAFFSGVSDGSDLFAALVDPFYALFGPEVGNMAATTIGQIWTAVEGLIGFFQANMPLMQATATAVFGSLQEIGASLAAVWSETLQPALAALFGAIIGEGPTAQETMTNLMNGIQQGAALVSQWVTDTLVPALEAFSAWIIEVAVPAIGELKVWLAENLPPAIQALSDLWTGTLQPALAAVWEFITVSLIPAIVLVAQWIGENLPPLIQALATFWTTTLQPALAAVWEFITTSLVPAIVDIATWIGENLPPLIEALAALWTDTLQPALAGLWQFITESLIPGFTSLVTTISETVTNAINAFKSNVIDPLSSAFDTLKSAVEGVFNWLSDLADQIANFPGLPDWMTPGSPTPFEIGLRGIADAAKIASKGVGLLGNAVSGLPGMAGMGTAGMAMVAAELRVGRLYASELIVAPISAAPVASLGRGGFGGGPDGGPTYNVAVTNNYSRWTDPPPAADDFRLAMAML